MKIKYSDYQLLLWYFMYRRLANAHIKQNFFNTFFIFFLQ